MYYRAVACRIFSVSIKPVRGWKRLTLPIFPCTWASKVCVAVLPPALTANAVLCELAAAGITDIEAANRYLREVYLLAFNVEFARAATEEGSAFVAWIGGSLDDILCEQYERTVSADNCVRFEKLILQIPADRHRCHYVKARVRVHRYASGDLALFHGPRKLADYNREGKTINPTLKQAA